MISLGAKDGNTMKIATKNLDVRVAEISSYESNVVTNDANNDDDNEVSLCGTTILEPLRRKVKAASYGRLKSSSERKKKKSNKGTSPMLIESRDLVAQATHDETQLPDYSGNANQIRNAFCPSNIGGPIVNLNIIIRWNHHASCRQGLQMDFPHSLVRCNYHILRHQGIVNGFAPFTS